MTRKARKEFIRTEARASASVSIVPKKGGEEVENGEDGRKYTIQHKDHAISMRIYMA